MSSISNPAVSNNIFCPETFTEPPPAYHSVNHPFAQAETGTPARRTWNAADMFKCAGISLGVVGLGVTTAGAIAGGITVGCMTGDDTTAADCTNMLAFTAGALSSGVMAMFEGMGMYMTGRSMQKKMESIAQQPLTGNGNAFNFATV